MVFSTIIKRLSVVSLFSVCVLVGAPQQAWAITLDFENISRADPVGHYAGNFSLDVIDLGAGNVLFQIMSAAAPMLNYFMRTAFADNMAPPAFVTLPVCYAPAYPVDAVVMPRLEDGSLSQYDDAGFSNASNPNRDTPGNGNAIQQGKTGGFTSGVSGGSSSAIGGLTSGGPTSGGSRFGVHLQRFPSDEADTVANSVTPVPLPAAGTLLLGALGGLWLGSRRKRPIAT